MTSCFPIRLKRFSSFEDEADWVAKDIERRQPKDRACCVVLARTRKLLDQAIQSFEKLNVPAYLAMRKDEFVSPPLCWVHASLRLTNSQQDREQLRRLCKAFYAIEGIQIDAKDVASSAATSDGNFLRAFIQTALLRRESLKNSTISVLEKSFPKLIDKLDYNTFLAETFLWLDEMQGSMSGAEEDLSDYPDEKATWLELQSEIASQYGGQEQVTLHILLQELDMRSKAPKPPKGAVPCFTIHASKGMEFDHVYLIGLVEDQLPSWSAVKKGDNSHEMQEERRNCFVAITRTEETLTLSYSDKVFGYTKRPSRFLREMGLIA